MKYLILGTALALALPLAGNVSVANAQDVSVSVGDHHRDNWHGEGWRHRNHWRGAYASGCRTIITNRINGRGDRVTVRKRVCG